MPLRVVFADDNYLVREGVAALLAETQDVELVEPWSPTPAALHAVGGRAPARTRS